jgi:hypothetical protein
MAKQCSDGSLSRVDSGPRRASIFAAAVVLGLGGCGIGGGTAELTVSWSIRNVDGSEVGCDPSYSSITVHVMNYSSRLEGNEQELTKTFDCAAGMGTWTLPLSGEIPAEDGYGFPATYINGHYDVWISQTDSTGEVIRQSSVTEYFVDLNAGDQTVEHTLYEDGGYLGVSWDFVAESSASLDLDDCAAAGVDTIEVTAIAEGTGAMTTTRFPCENRVGHQVYVVAEVQWLDAGSAELPVLAAGEYDVIVRAYMGDTLVGSSDEDPFSTVEGLNSLPEYSTYDVVITTR